MDFIVCSTNNGVILFRLECMIILLSKSGTRRKCNYMCLIVHYLKKSGQGVFKKVLMGIYTMKDKIGTFLQKNKQILY